MIVIQLQTVLGILFQEVHKLNVYLSVCLCVCLSLSYSKPNFFHAQGIIQRQVFASCFNQKLISFLEWIYKEQKVLYLAFCRSPKLHRNISEKHSLTQLPKISFQFGCLPSFAFNVVLITKQWCVMNQMLLWMDKSI